MKDIRRPDFLSAAMTSRSHSSLREMLMALLVFFLGSLAGNVVEAPALMFYLLSNETYMNMIQSGRVNTQTILDLISQVPDWMIAVTTCTSVGILAATIFYCKMIERRKIYSMGFIKKSWLRFYLIGLGLGAVMMSLVYIGCMMFGSIQVHLAMEKRVGGVALVLFFVGYMIQGMAEEALCRGLLFVSLTKRYTVSFSLVISSVFYAFLEGLNKDLSVLSYVNLVLFGYLMGLLFLRFENIWLIGAFHGIWDFMQVNVWGEAVSQTVRNDSLFSTTFVEGMEIVHGGTHGVESGMMVTVVLFVMVVSLILEMHQKGFFVVSEPVENPYDRAYYEGFQKWLKEKNRPLYEEYRQRNQGIVTMPVNEEMIRQVSQKKEEPKKEPGQIQQTDYDRHYFKE